jgi:hypothetical protein
MLCGSKFDRSLYDYLLLYKIYCPFGSAGNAEGIAQYQTLLLLECGTRATVVLKINGLQKRRVSNFIVRVQHLSTCNQVRNIQLKFTSIFYVPALNKLFVIGGRIHVKGCFRRGDFSEICRIGENDAFGSLRTC